MIGNAISSATPIQKAMAVAIVVATLALLAAGILEFRKDKPMTVAPDTLQGSQVPLMDMGAPTMTETATFALG
jgi:hypothetical protein